MAAESMVLVKNEGALLPLQPTEGMRVAVLGPNANRTTTLLSNYPGCTDEPGGDPLPECTLVTPLAGMKSAIEAAEYSGSVEFQQGCDIDTDDTSGFDAAVELARQSDVAVIVGGLITCQETGDQCQEAEAYDRVAIGLPGVQEDFIKAVAATGTPTVLVILSGASVSLPAFAAADSGVAAIVYGWVSGPSAFSPTPPTSPTSPTPPSKSPKPPTARTNSTTVPPTPHQYPGEEGGTALADVLLGAVNPSGRLPETVFTGLDQLPEDYLSLAMDDAPGRTHRYLTETPLYAFGFGLSYSRRTYSQLTLEPASIEAGAHDPSAVVAASVVLECESGPAGDEVVQLYVSLRGDVGRAGDAVSRPVRELKGFSRVACGGEAGAKQTVTIDLPVEELYLAAGADSTMQLIEGTYDIWVGGVGPAPQGLHADLDGQLQPAHATLVVG